MQSLKNTKTRLAARAQAKHVVELYAKISHRDTAERKTTVSVVHDVITSAE